MGRRVSRGGSVEARMKPDDLTALAAASRTDLLALIARQQAFIAEQQATIERLEAAVAEVEARLRALEGRGGPGAPAGMPGHKPAPRTPTPPPKPRKRRAHGYGRRRATPTAARPRGRARARPAPSRWPAAGSAHPRGDRGPGRARRRHRARYLAAALPVLPEAGDARPAGAGRGRRRPAALRGGAGQPDRHPARGGRLPIEADPVVPADRPRPGGEPGRDRRRPAAGGRARAGRGGRHPRRIRASPVVHADETGWREAGRNGYAVDLQHPDGATSRAAAGRRRS